MKNSKIIVIGDVHGRSDWKWILELEKHKYSKVIFLGDYFDSFDILYNEQIFNFKEILKLKEKAPKKVELLIGNHDYMYYASVYKYSGYQSLYAQEIKHEITPLMKSNILKAHHQENDILFTHAGVTKTWLSDNNLTVNIISDMMVYKPKVFEITQYNPYGDHPSNSPIWVRPDSLLKDKVDGFIQIVGHTSGNTWTKDNCWFVDSLEYKQYLVIENDKFIIKSF